MRNGNETWVVELYHGSELQEEFSVAHHLGRITLSASSMREEENNRTSSRPIETLHTYRYRLQHPFGINGSSRLDPGSAFILLLCCCWSLMRFLRDLWWI